MKNRMMAVAAVMIALSGAGIALPARSYAQGHPVVDQASDDVSLLVAESVRIEMDRPVEIAWQDCKPLQDRSRRLMWDCTEPFEWTYGYPSMHEVIFTNEEYQDNKTGNGRFFCELLRVTTATSVSAVRNSRGVGFWYEGLPNWSGLRMIPRDRLVQVALVELRDGREAYLHRFIGLANCTGSVSRYGFKPYMEFADASATYRNWDRYDGNYWVGPQFKFLDRSRFVLRAPR